MKLTKEQMQAPRVSDVLNLYFPISPFIKDEHKELGTSRHKWFAAIARGWSIDNTPHPRIAKEVNTFRKFWSQCNPQPKFIEEPFYDPIGIHGTPDLVAIIAGRLVVLDYKPPTKSQRTQIQTAAYFHMLRSNGVMVQDRYELRIDDDGYKLEEHRRIDNVPHWLAMVAGFNAAGNYKGGLHANRD